jgi:cobalt-zinc-cadmium efflux system outer membrane protein
VKQARSFGYLALAVGLIAAAACVRYEAKPIEPGRVLEDFEARRLDAPELGTFLVANKEVESWPPPAWDLKSLTLAAFYYHPDMDIARAQWGVARGGEKTAGERPNPTLGLLAGYNATSPKSEVTPWIPEVSLDIPIEVAGKRRIRIAQAQQLAASARWQILATAWEVRSRLRTAFLEVYASGEMETLLSEEEKLQTELVRLLERQKEIGEASGYDLTQARVALDQSRLAAIEAARRSEEARAVLAAAVGVPRRALEGARLSFDSLRRPQPDFPAGEVRLHAIVNRSDILGALAEYEASQAALKLEIAKQYPDINLGPDYQLDQTDSKWTLGLSIELPILSHNKGPIAEAAAVREERAARFLALQSQVIAELDAAIEDCRAALKKSGAADDLLSHLAAQERTARSLLELGELSKPEYLGIRIELNAGAQARLEALVQAQEAVGRLENAAQSPLDVNDWITTLTRGETKPAKESSHD